MPISKHACLLTAAVLLSTIGWTSPSWAGADTQTAEDGGLYRMPAGDFRTSADFRDGDRIIPFRSATPDSDLARLKDTSSSARAKSAAVPEATQPRALFTECVTN